MVLSADPNRRGSATMSHPPPVLDVVGLSVDLHRREGPLRLVSDISLSLSAGRDARSRRRERFGQERHRDVDHPSASARRCTSPTGSVRFEGRDLTSLSSKELRAVRGKEIGVVFQDPQNSLDPVVHHRQPDGRDDARAPRADRRAKPRARAISLLDRVGIPNAARRIQRLSRTSCRAAWPNER